LDKKCQWCGKFFITDYACKNFCSENCRRNFYNAALEIGYEFGLEILKKLKEKNSLSEKVKK